MKRCLLLAVLGTMIAALVNACATDRSVAVDQRFWEDRGTAVGIVLAVLPDPEVTVRTGSATVSRKDQTHTMSRRYQQDFDRDPWILRNQRELWHYLRGEGLEGSSAFADVMEQRLDAYGYRPVRVEGPSGSQQEHKAVSTASGYAERNYRNIPGVQGLDFLVILSVQRYGVYCYYMDERSIFTDVYVELTGEMVDLATNRLVWRSAFRDGRVRRSVTAGCEDPLRYPLIVEELDRTLGLAASGIVDDFFSGAPPLVP